MAEESSDTDEVRPTVGTVFVGIFLDRISNGFRVVCSYIAGMTDSFFGRVYSSAFE